MRHEKLFDGFGAIAFAEEGESLRSLDVLQIRALLREHGAVLLRGHPPSLEDFREFTGRFSSSFLRHGASAIRPAVSGDGTVAEVLIGQDHVDLHGEMYYLPFRPDLLWLMCSIPATSGGQTTVCDAVAMLESMSPELTRLFREKPLKFAHRWEPKGWQAILGESRWEDAHRKLQAEEGVSDIRLDADGVLSFSFVTSAIARTRHGGREAFINSIANIRQYRHLGGIQVTFADGTELSDGLVDEINRLGERCSENVEWRAGDLLLLDNSRVMHGRRAFSGERKISTRFSRLEDGAQLQVS